MKYITICAESFKVAFKVSGIRINEETDTIVIGSLDQRLEIKHKSEWRISNMEDDLGVRVVMVSPDGKTTIEYFD